MDWSNATSWWIVAGVLVAAELATGTFYLLMLAVGGAAAAIAAQLGVGLNGELLTAALIGGGAVAAWHFKRGQMPAALPAGANRDVNLDIGGSVHVAAWDPEGKAQVSYRGATWQARHAGSGTPRPGAHVIHAIEGTCLLLEPSPLSH